LARLTDFISRLTSGLSALGALGLALIAVLDSSFVPLPGAVDASVIFLTTQNPDRWLLYAVAATAGSMSGCFLLYAVARKGGEAFLKKRFKERHVAKGLDTFRRYGLLAIVVPAILPPPAPFKLFVLLAGVTEVPRGSFLLAVAIGRAFRYGASALLAKWYGAQAGRFIREELSWASIWFAVAVAVGGVVWFVWRRRQAA
jgi:membrane protein YqaA with SNARE-associated domain